MNNLHNEFKTLNENVKLTTSKKKSIISSRNAVREKIRKYFKDELKVNQPKFQIQGSFTINTALMPIDGCEVDIDDGVYLQHIKPDENKPSPSNIHKSIITALSGHTQDGCKSKTSCVRVTYINRFHIDLPVYIIEDDVAFLGETKGNEWIKSDSKEFRNWFYQNRKEEQVNRIIRYLKAWRDYCSLNITSIEFSILCIENYVNNDRDDLSLLYTLEKIIIDLIVDRSVNKPVSPFENLWESFTENEINNRIDLYKELVSDLKTALNNESLDKASTILIELFGNRFPKIKEQKENSYKKIETGAMPWGKQ